MFKKSLEPIISPDNAMFKIVGIFVSPKKATENLRRLILVLNAPERGRVYYISHSHLYHAASCGALQGEEIFFFHGFT